MAVPCAQRAELCAARGSIAATTKTAAASVDKNKKNRVSCSQMASTVFHVTHRQGPLPASAVGKMHKKAAAPSALSSKESRE